MNRNLAYLYKIIQQKERTILGLMSGTSLDGLDLALCRFTGSGLQTQVQVMEFVTIPYPASLRAEIVEVFSQKNVKLPKICLLHQKLARLYAQFIQEALANWGKKIADIDCIASHGQTIYHFVGDEQNPQIATLQIADGDHLAHLTGLLTLSDFRQKQVAAGGEGAPLAIYGDYFLFSKLGESRVLMNIGGVANFSYLPASQAPHEVFATDTGPGNSLMDTAIKTFFSPLTYDDGGKIAAQGQVNTSLLAALKSAPFFQLAVPKTTGPEIFNWDYVQAAQQQSQTSQIAPVDLVATLMQFTAETIADTLKEVLKESVKVYVSGGGAHNVTLMDTLKKLLPQHTFHPFQQLGVSPDAKEAVFFAMIANEALVGNGVALGDRFPQVSMGKISFPY